MVPPTGVPHNLREARLSDARTVDTPLELNASYSSSDGVALSDPSLYRTLVGSLVYLTITRPDIAYAVHIVSQFVASPTTVHWVAVLCILRYLRGTQFQSLLFPSTSTLDLRAYSDADWGDPTPMHCDNVSAFQITRNSVFHERTKHIEIDCHLTRHHY
ncbi:secreted RxLR effector protein 161-like [Humulus lupulus]|uniref:secreted RxLR effector protein 161-like n=1 Tax=Humulus lupulus TaxID=3486 RepID=UPI002B40D161|nr:secreted RxLR effector protein 161-like [Humulus lupulus]